MKLEQAAQQALEALESCNVGNWSMAFDEFAVVEAITALREALDEPDIEEMTLTQIAAKHEQAKQESVTNLIKMSKANFERHWGKNDFADWIYSDIADLFSDYAAPVRTKDLTDDEIYKIFSKYASDLYKARAVIAADREKNK